MLEDNEYELEISSDEICRSCLNQEKNLKSLFCSEILDGQIVSFPKIFQDVTEIKITKNDHLPSRICSNCKLKVNEFYIFKEKCRRSHELALSIFLKTDVNESWAFELVEDAKHNEEESITSPATEVIHDSNIAVNKEISPQLLDENLTVNVKTEILQLTDGDELESDFDVSNIKSEPNIIENSTTGFIEDDQVEEEANESGDNEAEYDELKNSTEYLEEQDYGIVELIDEDSPELGELSCEICKIEFTNKIEFIDHIKSHDLTEGVLIDSNNHLSEGEKKIKRKCCKYGDYCKFCKTFVKHKSNDTEFFKKHIDLHRQTLKIILETFDLYKCANCNLVFTDKTIFKEHVNSVEYCENTMTTELELLEYKCFEMEVFENEFESQNPIKLINCSKINQNGLLDCKSCSRYQTSDIDLLVEHTENEHNTNMDVYNDGLNICNICNKWSGSLVEILMHIYFHTKTYNCPFLNCAVIYNSFAKLSTHLERTHLFLNTPTCNHCDEKFKTYDELTVHLKRFCEKRIFKCEDCGKTFLSNSSLGVHKRIHSQNIMYVCQFCGKKFTQSGDLKIHVRLHTGEKPYKCPLCPKQFRTSGNRQDHMESHNDSKNFFCEICLKSFKGERVLKAHMVIHSGEKKFICPICGKQFYRKQHVKSHLRVHDRRPSKHKVMDWLDDDGGSESNTDIKLDK